MAKKPAAKAAKKSAAAKTTRIPLPKPAVDVAARKALKLIAAALAGMSGFPSEEQALVDAATRAAADLEA